MKDDIKTNEDHETEQLPALFGSEGSIAVNGELDISNIVDIAVTAHEEAMHSRREKISERIRESVAERDELRKSIDSMVEKAADEKLESLPTEAIRYGLRQLGVDEPVVGIDSDYDLADGGIRAHADVSIRDGSSRYGDCLSGSEFDITSDGMRDAARKLDDVAKRINKLTRLESKARITPAKLERLERRFRSQVAVESLAKTEDGRNLIEQLKNADNPFDEFTEEEKSLVDG